MRTDGRADKPKAICSPLFQSWGHKYIFFLGGGGLGVGSGGGVGLGGVRVDGNRELKLL